MTPKQIRLLILYEARWLSIFPILISAVLGYVFSYGVLTVYSSLTSEVTGSKLTISFSPWAVLAAMILSFLTGFTGSFRASKTDGKTASHRSRKRELEHPYAE